MAHHALSGSSSSKSREVSRSSCSTSNLQDQVQLEGMQVEEQNVGELFGGREEKRGKKGWLSKGRRSVASAAAPASVMVKKGQLGWGSLYQLVEKEQWSGIGVY
jgi:hypothetical protein